MFHNYRAELDKGKTPGSAIVASIKDVGTAMFLAALTTIIAFLSFLTASIPPLRDFGILCALGIFYTFITTITLQASIRYVLDRRSKVSDKLKPKKDLTANTMKKISKIVYKYSGVFLIIACIVTVAMFVGATSVKTGFDIEDFLPEDNPAIELWEDINTGFPYSSQNQEYILIEGDVASVTTLKGIYATNNKLKDDKFVAIKPDGGIKVNSALSVIQDAVRENSTIASVFNLDQNGIPSNDNDVKRLYDYLYDYSKYWLEIREVLHRNGDSYDATVIRVYIDFSTSNEEHATKLKILYNELNGDITDYGDTTAIVTGGASSSHVVTNLLT
jgi:predicted RND superfamily exporter protein